MRAAFLIFVSIFAAACASVQPIQLVSPAPYQPALSSGEGAEILLFDERIVFEPGLAGSSRTRYFVHQLIEIQSQEGLDGAYLKLPLSPKEELVSLDARTLQPDGSVVVVPASAVQQAENSDGSRLVAIRFPAVAVGSRLEFAMALERPWLEGTDEVRIRRQAKSRRYRVELEAPASLPIVAVQEPGHVPFERTERDGNVVHRLELADVPAAEFEEPFEGHWSQHEPFWRYRIEHWDLGAYEAPIANTFGEALWFRSEPFFLDETIAAQFRPALRKLAPDAMVRAVWNDARRLRLEPNAAPRPLDEVMVSGHASALERALLIHKTLHLAGIKSLPAVARGEGELIFDPGFPSSAGLRHTLLLVPEQKGIAPAIWIDPSCDGCAAGEVAPDVAGRQAVVHWAESRGYNMPPVYKHSLVDVKAPAAPGELVRTWRFLPGAGNRVEVVSRSSGFLADKLQRLLDGGWSAAEDERQAMAFFASSRGELESLEPTRCDKAQRSCSRSVVIRIPSGGDARLLSLEFLPPGPAGDLLADRRRSDIQIEVPWNQSDEVNFELPPGAVPLGLPAPRRVVTDGFESESSFSVEEGRLVVRRSIRAQVGSWPSSNWKQIRAVAEAFTSVKNQVIELRAAASVGEQR